MLKTDLSTTLNGQSVVNGTIVAYYSANISTDNTATSTVTSSVSSKELYDANREEVRQDFLDFQEAVYKVEDETTTTTTSTTSSTTTSTTTSQDDLADNALPKK